MRQTKKFWTLNFFLQLTKNLNNADLKDITTSKYKHQFNKQFLILKRFFYMIKHLIKTDQNDIIQYKPEENVTSNIASDIPISLFELTLAGKHLLR